MGRRKKTDEFNVKLSSMNDICKFVFKDTNAAYYRLEGDLNIKFEYAAKQMKRWKRDFLSLIEELHESYLSYMVKCQDNKPKLFILTRLLSFLFAHLSSLGFSELCPNLSEIIPEELQHTHYDGQSVKCIIPTTPHYKTLLKKAVEQGKPIKKVSRRKDVNLPKDFYCQHCHAPVDYLYLNTPNQVLCKCCGKTTLITYSRNLLPHDDRCPHCNRKLEHRIDRTGYSVYRCSNFKCPFYLNNKTKMNKVLKDNPDLGLTYNHFKLHYTFRHFYFDIEVLKNAPINPEVFQSLNQYESIYKKLHSFNQQVFLLCLAYRHNYSISKSKIASIMTELHDVPITSQTVDNYLNMMATILRPYVENYPYKVSQKIVADETYIKINGKKYYLYRYFDYDTNIIISQYLSDKRDTIATFNSLNKCLTTIQDTVDLTNLTLVVDGYTPYQIVATDLNNNYNGKFNINVIPLIGLKNHSKEYLPYVPDKQAIERDHRNFKVAYHNSSNFRSIEAALNYCTLHQAVHNFITRFRKTSKIPVKLPSLNKNDSIIDRWDKLLFESINYINKTSLIA